MDKQTNRQIYGEIFGPKVDRQTDEFMDGLLN